MFLIKLIKEFSELKKFKGQNNFLTGVALLHFQLKLLNNY